MVPDWQREHRIYETVSVWGSALLVLAIWPILFLVIFLGYLNFPVITLLLMAAIFLTWRFLRTLPRTLRSSASGKRHSH